MARHGLTVFRERWEPSEAMLGGGQTSNNVTTRKLVAYEVYSTDKAATWQDDFNDNVLDPNWDRFYSGDATQITNVNGRLQMTHANQQYQTMLTKARYDMRESSIYVETVNVGDMTAHPSHSAQLMLYNDSHSKFWIEASANVIAAWRIVNDVQTQIGANITYDAVAHKWFRIRETGGQMFIDTSPNGTTWTNRFGPLADPFDMRSVLIGMSTGNWNAADGAGDLAYFDNFNIVGVAAPDPKVFDFKENWDSGINLAIWNNWGGAPNVVVTNGQLVLKNNPGTTDFDGINTIASHDFTGSFASIEVISLPNIVQPDTSYSVGILSAEIDTNNRYYWSHEVGNNVIAMKVTAGAYAYQGEVAYNPALHKYFRIREASGTVYYEWSTNGQDWFTTTSTPVTTPVTALKINFGNGHWAVVNNQYEATLGDVNILPTASVPNAAAWFQFL